MKYVILIVVSLIIFSCNSDNACCYRLKQDFVSWRDSGYNEIYVCKDSCLFVTEKLSIKEDYDKYGPFGYSNEVRGFKIFPKVISKEYFEKFKTLIRNKGGVKFDSITMVNIEVLDTRGKKINEIFIDSINFPVFSENIRKINKQYNIDENKQIHFDWFLETINKGVFYSDTIRNNNKPSNNRGYDKPNY